MIYQVLDWNKHFENNKSRSIKECSHVYMPNKHHGLGLARILSMKDGLSIFGVWVLIVESCSQQFPPRDGWLTQDGHLEGTPWAPSDLALKYRRSEQEIKRALDVLSSPEIGWIKATPTGQDEGTTGAPQGHLEGSTVLQKEQKEQKEQNKTEPAASPLAPPSGFVAFMDAYPSQVEREAALKNWKTLVKKGVATEGELTQAAKNYADACREKNTEPQYIIRARNFLGRDERFKDYLAGAYHPAAKTAKPMSEESRKLMEEIFRT